MPGRLRATHETQTMTFEVFNLDLDDEGRQQLAADPRGFLNNLLQEEGQQVNGLLVDDDLKFKTENGTTSAALPPSVWHCTSPPDKASRWITIVPGVTDDE